jgi:hypothetical protein
MIRSIQSTNRDVGLDLSVSNQATFHDPSGLLETFTKSGSTYTAPPGADATLTTYGTGYKLTDNASGDTLTFDANGYLIGAGTRGGANQSYGHNFAGTPGDPQQRGPDRYDGERHDRHQPDHRSGSAGLAVRLRQIINRQLEFLQDTGSDQLLFVRL